MKPRRRRSQVPRSATILLLASVLLLLAVVSVAAEPPSPYEGWRQLETEHFRIVYEPAHAAAAREVARYAESVYERITPTLDYYPEKVPVIIRGRTATANGYYTPFPHQINLFVTSPSGPWLGAKTESWLELLFIHEFTHYLHFGHRAGFLGTLSRLFGHDLTAAHALFYPGWLVEGVTTTNESYYTKGGRGSNPFFHMKYRAFLEEGGLWDYKKSKFGSAFAPQDRIYVAGYLYVDYLRRNYGDAVMGEIHKTFARAPILGIPRAVRKVTGVSASELHRRMAAELQERYTPAVGRIDRLRVSPSRPGDWYLPRGTEDGWFFYSGSHDDPPGIWFARDLDSGLTGARQLLTVRLTDSYSFDVTGDGGLILFTAAAPDPLHPAGLVSFSDLYSFETGGSKPRRLTEGQRLWQPAVAPDGTAAVAVERDGSYSRLLGVDPGSGETYALFDRPETTVSYPVFSPDGRSLAFVVNRRGTQDLYLARLARFADPQGTSRYGTAQPVLSGGPSRQPAGGAGASGSRRIAFEAVTNLTADWKPPVYLPRFASNTEILFSSDKEAVTALYLADIGAGELLEVLQDPVSAWGGVAATATPADERGSTHGVADPGVQQGAWLPLFYGSYTTDGHTLFSAIATPERAGTLSDEPVSALDQTAIAESSGAPTAGPGDSAGVQGSEEPLDGRRYRDFPAPVFWFPLLGAAGTIDEGPAVSAGGFLAAVSLLQRQQLLGTMLYTPRLRQPSLSLQYSYAAGPVSLNYSLVYQYEEDETGGTAELTNTVGLGVPLLRRYPIGSSISLDSFWSLGTEHDWYHPAGFGVDELGRSALAAGTEVFGSAGLSFARRAISAPKAFYGSAAESLDSEIRYAPALLDRSQASVESVTTLAILRPFPWWHHAVGLTFRGGTSNLGEGTELVGPRGGAPWNVGTGDWEVLPSLRYLLPLGLWEGRFLGVNVLGGGAFLFAETAFFGDFGGRAEWAEEYYLGAELNVSMQVFNIVPLIGQAGVVARVDPERGIEKGTEDLYVYVNASVSIPSVSRQGSSFWTK